MMGTTIALRRRRRRGHDTVGDDSASVPSSVVIARASSAADVMPLRERVMYPGQPERCAQEDDDDDTTIHLVARIVAPIATAEDASSTASIVGVISVFPNADGTDGKEAIETFYGFGTNKALSSRAVIVAIPPALRQKITFTPGLNGEYRQFLQRSPLGSKFKVLAVYAEAFWREEGYCGLGRGNLQILEETADSGPVESNPGVMVSFVAGNKAAAASNPMFAQKMDS